MMDADVTVLGGSGFLGSRICRHLTDCGFSVRAVGRRPRPEELGCEYLRLPMDPNDKDWIAAVGGSRCVIHAVGFAHYAGPADTAVAHGLFEANVETTAAVVAACRAADVERIVYVSSVKALGETSDEPLVSTAKCHPVTVYGRSKRAAELLVEQAGGLPDGPRGTIVRLPLVYGAGATGNLLRIARAVRGGRPIPVPTQEGARSVASINRVAVTLEALVNSSQAPGTVHVCDPAPISFGQMVTAIGSGLGRSPRAVRVPTSVLRGVLGAIGKIDMVSRWTDDLVMKGDDVASYPPTDDEAGTLLELASVAKTLG